MAGFSDAEIQMWAQRAYKDQQFYCDQLGGRGYDVFHGDDLQKLQLKIAYSMFGGLSHIGENGVDITGYTPEQQAASNVMYQQILKYSFKAVQAAFLLLSVKEPKKEYRVPVVRIPALNGGEYFVADDGNVYTSWEKFTTANQLPECRYIYPTSGHYTKDQNGSVQLHQTTSPRYNVAQGVLCAVEKALSYASHAAAILTVVGMAFPAAAPACLPMARIIETASVAYTTVKNGGKFVKRVANGQSINPLTDKEASDIFLDIAQFVLEKSSSQIGKHIGKLAQQGVKSSQMVKTAYNVSKLGTVAVESFKVIKGFTEVDLNDPMAPLKLANGCLGVYFFTNDVKSLKFADDVIKDHWKMPPQASKKT